MTAANETLRSLQTVLLRQFKKLHDSLDDVTDPDQAQAIVREMQEVNHRIAMVGGLLFAEASKELRAKTNAVTKATARVNKAIANIANLKGFMDTMTEFLGLVDEAIDLAKALA